MKESYYSRVEFGALLDDTWRKLCRGEHEESPRLVIRDRANIMKPCNFILGPVFKHKYEISDGSNKVQFEIELPHISYRDRVSEEFITETIAKLKALESLLAKSRKRRNTHRQLWKVRWSLRDKCLRKFP